LPSCLLYVNDGEVKRSKEMTEEICDEKTPREMLFEEFGLCPEDLEEYDEKENPPRINQLEMSDWRRDEAEYVMRLGNLLGWDTTVDFEELA
jgi:hypothetical protein